MLSKSYFVMASEVETVNSERFIDLSDDVMVRGRVGEFKVRRINFWRKLSGVEQTRFQSLCQQRIFNRGMYQNKQGNVVTPK